MIKFSKLSFLTVLLFAPIVGQGKSGKAKPADRYTALESFAKALFYIENMYHQPDKAHAEPMLEDALNGVIQKLDPHTMLMPKKAFEQLNIDTKGKFGGVGIIVSQKRHAITIISPIEGTPAHRAGIKAGDKILKIDGDDIKDLGTNGAVEKMRGPPGSTIKLTILRAPKQTLEFTMKREIIRVKSVRYSALTKDIGYTRITSFQETTAKELGKLLKEHGPKLKGMVLDLRDNPGGLLEQAVQVSDFFIDSGIIVSTVGRDKKQTEREYATKRNTYTKLKLAVLVNKGSASASEIVAGALQDYKRAKIMGQKSFGKGSVQTLISLPDGSGLKLTVALYYTPLDQKIQNRGILPDVILSTKKLKANQNIAKHLNKLSPTWPPGQKKDYELIYAMRSLQK